MTKPVRVTVEITEREISIIKLLMEDRPVKQITAELGISRTLYTYSLRVLRMKTGTNGRVSLIVWALRNKQVSSQL